MSLLDWALLLLMVALIAAALGCSSVAAAGIAQAIFFVLPVLFVILLVAALFTRRPRGKVSCTASGRQFGPPAEPTSCRPRTSTEALAPAVRSRRQVGSAMPQSETPRPNSSEKQPPEHSNIDASNA